MKYLFTIGLLALTITINAQSKETIKVMANARLLDQTVFGSKDSAALDDLFAKELTYIHSSGKTENREEALRNIIHNGSVYTKSPEPFPYSVSSRGDSLVVVHVFKATEKKANGTESALNLSIETVWVKEKKEWKLARRQATKIQ